MGDRKWEQRYLLEFEKRVPENGHKIRKKQKCERYLWNHSYKSNWGGLYYERWVEMGYNLPALQKTKQDVYKSNIFKRRRWLVHII